MKSMLKSEILKDVKDKKRTEIGQHKKGCKRHTSEVE